jgi:hypothetical protein
MVTFSFYNEIQITECSSSFNELKEKIKYLYFIDEEQIKKIIISYQDRDAQRHYISNEEEFDKIYPKIESIVLVLEILDDDKYLTIDPSFEEEFNSIYLLNLNNDNKDNDDYYGFYYDMDDLNRITEECFAGEIDEVEDEKDKEDKEIVHNGIKCNICGDENIEGIRYLCGVCNNFNLCQKCEKVSGERHNHPLLKIRNPQYAPLSFKCKLAKGEEQ